MTATNGTGAFGALLRTHRRAVGLSQEELAERAGISADGVAALERGRRRAPRPLTVRLLADALRLDDARRSELIAASRDQAMTGEDHRPPVPTAELIGRSGDLAAAAAALSTGRTRLLTLTGPGGIGKTRLALALAAAVRDGFAEQCWVPLEALPAGADITATVAAALGVRPAPAPGEWASTAARIADRRLLLLLDNCEHVLAGCAALCDWLLPRCAGLHAVTTSREPLHVTGEAVHRVRPLAIPRADAEPDDIRAAAAVQLFLARAAYPVPREQLADVNRLCRRLDGLALAIELAAARTNVLSVAQIADELERSGVILTQQSPTAPGRQRALESAIGWSHDLLTADEQRFFAAASAFRGGWSLSGAQAVAAEPDRARTLDLTSRLVDKSLIQVHHEGGAARYDMFVVVRQFAEHRLAGCSGWRAEVERRHVGYFADLAERAGRELHGPGQVTWLRTVDAELDNLREAMSLSARHSWARQTLRLAGGLYRYFYLRGRYGEGRRWLETALALDDATGPAPTRARALAGAGYLAFLQCEYGASAELLNDALRLHRRSGDRTGAALVLRALGSVARERAQYDLAVTLHQESLELARSQDDPSGVAWAQHHLGFVAWLRGDLATASKHAGPLREAFTAIGDHEGIVWSLISLGVIARYAGDLAAADVLLHEALDRARALAFREGVAWALDQLGVLAHRRGLPERAIHRLEESLAEHQELGDRWRMTSVLEALAAVVQDRGRSHHAAFLLGAADELRSGIGAPVPPCERPDRERVAAQVLAALGQEDFAQARAAGRASPVHAVTEGYPPSSGRCQGAVPG